MGGTGDKEVGGPVDKEVEGPGDKEVGGPGDKEVGGHGDKEVEGPGDKEVGGPGDKEVGGPGDKGGVSPHPPHLWQDQTRRMASGVPMPAPRGSPAGPNQWFCEERGGQGGRG